MYLIGVLCAIHTTYTWYTYVLYYIFIFYKLSEFLLSFAPYVCNCYRLDKNLTIKVADFGLSRDVYITDYYVASHSNPLPVKWLAPESLFDKVFSEKTDVVSSFCFWYYLKC